MYLSFKYTTSGQHIMSKNIVCKFILEKSIKCSETVPSRRIASFCGQSEFHQGAYHRYDTYRFYYFDCPFKIDELGLARINKKLKNFSNISWDVFEDHIQNTIINEAKKEERSRLRAASFAIKKFGIFHNRFLPKDIADIILGFACENEALLPESIKIKIKS